YLVMHETHPVANRSKTQDSVLQSYVALFRRLRFNAFVFQTGFNTGAFMVMAVGAASLMTELLHRPATEFGLYFLLFPMGFFTGTAAGVGVFMQNFCAAISTQAYGLLADGTPQPMIVMAVLCGLLTLGSGSIPYLLKRKASGATPF